MTHRPLLVLACLTGCGLISPDKGVDTAAGSPPMLNILTPARGEVIAESVGVQLVVMASDDQSGFADLTLSWVSDIDGAVAGPAALQPDGTARATLTLSPGTHNLTGTVVDADGDVDTAERTFVVDGMPGAPEVGITPAEPSSTDALVAALAFQPDLDPEGETVTHRWAWLRDGEPVPGAGLDRVPAEDTAEGEVWTVQVWASDSRQEGPPGTAEVVIGP